MDNDLRLKLMDTFLGELEGFVEQFNLNLIHIERKWKEGALNPKDEEIKILFRLTHTLKGAARAVSLNALEGKLHDLENIFSGYQTGSFNPDGSWFESLFLLADQATRIGDIIRKDPSVQNADSFLGDLPQTQVIDSAAPDSSPPSPAPVDQPLADSSTIRVRSKKLDNLIADGAELRIAWQELSSSLEWVTKLKNSEVGRESELIKQKARNTENLLIQMDGNIRKLRMLPVSENFISFERTVRDLCNESGKVVELELDCGNVELDRTVLEDIKSPLLHLIRNSIDHGIELPDDRVTAGKPKTAKIKLSAFLKGTQVHIVLQDDGRGVDLEKVKKNALKRSVILPQSDEEVLNLIFEPGLSTSKSVSEISGRGMGLDIVKSTIEGLQGSVNVESISGQGTRFTLLVPITLTSQRALIVRLGSQLFSVPTSGIDQIVRIHPDDLGSTVGRKTYFYNDKPIVAVHLSQLLELESTDHLKEKRAESEKILGLIVHSGSSQILTIIDEAMGEQEIVVKSLGKRLRDTKLLSGGTILSNGEVSYILNLSEIVLIAHQFRALSDGGPVRSKDSSPTAVGLHKGKTASAKKRILLAEDSITTRTMEKGILEGAGFEVLAAEDGAQAWRMLQEEGADAIVSDVEMPNMTGFELLEAVRSSGRFEKIPVVLVTALAKESDRKRGMDCGANAYIVKGDFSQNDLVKVVNRLI